MSKDLSAIAESVFQECCSSGENTAPVEKIVNFFKNQRDSGQWRLCNKEVDLLYDLLDPQSSCSSVDLSMLEDGLNKWVHYIQYRSSDEELLGDSVEECSIFDQCSVSKLPDHTDKSSPMLAGVSSDLAADSGMPLSGNLGEGVHRTDDEGSPDEYGDVSFGSRNYAVRGNKVGDNCDVKERFDSSSDFNNYNDVADILSRLHQIRHRNSVLVNEKKKLQAQLEAAEENLQQQQAQLAEWEKKNRSFQNVSRENKELQQEVEDLRGNIEQLEAAKRDLQAAHTQTERDVVYWQERAEEYSNMLTKHQQELDVRSKNCEDLKRSLLEHRETIEECNRLNRTQHSDLEDRSNTVRNMNEILERLNAKNEQLISEKEERDIQLKILKEEIRKYRLICHGTSLESPSSQSALNESHDNLLRVNECRRKCSTPHRIESLQSELVEGMFQDRSLHLPSPFCEKATPNKLRCSRSVDLSLLNVSHDAEVSSQSLDELSPKAVLELERNFIMLINSMSGDNDHKEKCTTIFKNVLTTHQRLCKKLNNDVRQIQGERDFLQTRYQEALQQLRDTSCLLETDISDKLASLEDQIKAEQLYRLEMEAQLAKYKEEEMRLSKEEKSTQARLQPFGLTDKLPQHLNLSCSVGDEKSYEFPAYGKENKWKHVVNGSQLIQALDLSHQFPISAKSSKNGPVSNVNQPYRSVNTPLQPLLPEFDLEFSYSFDTTHHRGLKRDPTESVCEVPSISEAKDEDDQASIKERRELKGRKFRFEPRVGSTSPTPTLSSSFSWQSGARQIDSSIKESDVSEDRDRASTATTTSSVEDIPSSVMPELPSVQTASQPPFVEPSSNLRKFNSEVTAVADKHAVNQDLREMTMESGACSMQANSQSHPGEAKIDEDDTVFTDDIQPSDLRSRGQRVGFTETKAKFEPPPQQQQMTSSVFPNLPNSKLKEVDLFPDSLENTHNWTEEEAEQKFTHLSLAFRTDRQTLEERIKLHIGGRDTAEKNAKIEIDTVRQIANGMSQIPNFPMEVVSNLQYTCKILEHSIHRLASKSEILGAVQQEGRLSHAVEVMLHHMDNLKRAHSRNSRDLEEARRILKEGRYPGNSNDISGETPLSKRSLSLIGGGSPVKSLRRTSTTSRKSTVSTDGHDTRSRFQVAAQNTAIQTSVTHYLHRLPVEKHHRSLSSQESGPEQGLTTSESTAQASGSHDSNGRVAKVSNASETGMSSTPDKDAIFQKGLEQGLRTQVGNELGTLREEQASLTESLDYLMEMHSLVEEDGEDTDSDIKGDFVDLLITKGSHVVSMWKHEISFLRARWIAGAAAFVLALFILLWSVLWSVSMRHPSSAPS